MGLQAKNLTIIFREIQPEQLYRSIREEQPYGKYKDRTISVDKIDETVFQSLAHAQYPMYSHEEIGNVYSILWEQMRLPNDHTSGTPSVFHLLVGMGRRVLRWQPGAAPICEFSEIFHGEMHIRIWGRTSLQLRTWLMKISVKEDSSGVNLAGAPF